ncbi:MAG: hypothetical protein KDD58_16345, partial [Bdellovibrionales bacterium]|nr:hypothetical protein [Bdellovibrionales bacterium]
NPVEAGICNFVEEYEYSTINGLLGLSRLTIEAHDYDTIENTETALIWLNRSANQDYCEYIRKGLRRKVFKLPKVNRADNPLEKELL